MAHQFVLTAAVAALLAGVLHAQDQVWGLIGYETGELYGMRVAAMGWVNNDQWPDVLVSAPDFGNRRGRVQVLNGRDGALIHSLQGNAPEERFGYAIDAVANIDGDGTPDFIVGAYGWNYSQGRVVVYSGRTAAVLYELSGLHAGVRFGFSVASAGDVDHDGRTDFLVGAPQLGEAYLYSGASGAMINRFGSADFIPWDYATSLCAAGDVNADGRLDVMIGAPLNDGASTHTKIGFVFLYDARDGFLVGAACGTNDYDQFGLTLAAAGDVNGDGHDDYLIGAPVARVNGMINAGYARLMSGRDHTVLFEKKGVKGWDEVGASLSGNRDIDRDGYLDFVIGADHAGIYGQGRITAHSGRDFSQIGWAELVGFPPQSSEFGYASAIVGDVTGDGKYDVVVGAPRLLKYAGFTGMYSFKGRKDR